MERYNSTTERFMRKIIQTDCAPQAIGPYSQAVVYNGVAYLSGQIPIDPATGELVPADIVTQTERVLENLKLLLGACGSSMSTVLKTTVYLKDMNHFAQMNEVYARFFTESPPARAAVEAARLPKDVLIEVDAIAAVD